MSRLSGFHKRKIFPCIFIIVGLSVCGISQAQELFPPVREVNGIRSLGLGIPSVALSGLANGESSLSNPAWVGQEGKSKQKSLLRGLWFPAATVGANGTTRSLAKAYFSGQSSTQQRLENFLKASQNEQTPFASLSLQPGLSVGPVYWGVFGRVRIEGYVWQPTSLRTNVDVGLSGAGDLSRISSSPTPASLLTDGGASGVSQMDVRATVERGTQLSLSVPYKNTGLYLGVTFRPTWRSDFVGSVGLDEPLISASATSLRAKFNETKGYPVDVGAVVRLPQVRLKPTVGMKIEDVTDTRFQGAGAAHQTMIQKSNLNAGLAFWPLLNARFGSQCTFAAHHLNDNRLEWSGKWGGGCEFHILGQAEADLISNAPLVLRVGGDHQGLAYGLSWDMPFAILEIASQVARVEGPVGYSARSDRRYFLKLSVDASQP